jgi:two-component system, chemotaxis family, chemotaxis protein CheY
MLILVVDQNKAMIRIVRNLLKQLDFQNVDDANDRSEAVTKLHERKYGLAICDMHTELVTDWDLSRDDRVDQVLQELPLIIMMDQSDPAKVNAAKRAGVSTTIVKPFTANTLKGKIETELNNRRRHVRRRVVKGGQLVYAHGASTTECLIRDLSESGARIQVANAQDIPAEIVLSFDDGRASRPCMVKWRRNNELGVEFGDTADEVV